MLKFCRSCGKELARAEDRTCHSCGANAVKATCYCRYCGHPTKDFEVTCSHCGAALKPLPGSVRSRLEFPGRSVKLGKIINLTIVIVLVTAYIVFTLPKSVTKSIQASTADIVLDTVGYTAFPLNSISAFPPRIPRTNPERTLRAWEDGAIINLNPDYIPIFQPNDTEQLAISALYRNAAANNASGDGRLLDVTDNCSYTSKDDKIATVTSGGLVKAVAVGNTSIVVSYTAAPGSANISEAGSIGKTPITVTTTVSVIVTKLPVSLGGKP